MVWKILHYLPHPQSSFRLEFKVPADPKLELQLDLSRTYIKEVISETLPLTNCLWFFTRVFFLQGMAKSINKERNQNEGQRMFFIYSFHFVVAKKDLCICSLFSLEQIKVCLKSQQKITRAVLQKRPFQAHRIHECA